MEYAIDILLNIMDRISSSKPIFFQANGALYVASEEGFGYTGRGLTMRDDHNDVFDPRTLLESIDLLVRDAEGQGTEPDQKIELQEGEENHAQAITSVIDNLNLETVKKAARRLQELPDDGKVRIVEAYRKNDWGFHSEVEQARAMDRRIYLELLREREIQFRSSLASHTFSWETRSGLEISKALRDHFPSPLVGYQHFRFPSYTIITSQLLFSFPREGKLNHPISGLASWIDTTEIDPDFRNSLGGSLLHHDPVDVGTKSPFGVHLKVNAADFFGGSVVGEMYAGFRREADRQVAAVLSAMPSVERYVAELNGLHDQIREAQGGEKSCKPYRRRELPSP